MKKSQDCKFIILLRIPWNFLRPISRHATRPVWARGLARACRCRTSIQSRSVLTLGVRTAGTHLGPKKIRVLGSKRYFSNFGEAGECFVARSFLDCCRYQGLFQIKSNQYKFELSKRDFVVLYRHVEACQHTSEERLTNPNKS